MTSATTGATVEQRKIEDKLVREHLPLVHYAVSEMAAKIPRHVSRDDLVSAGMAGLAQSLVEYDSRPSVKLRYDLTYMCSWTLWLDIRLLFRSVAAALSGSGV